MVEIAEGSEGTGKKVIRVLLKARQDIETVLHALGHKEKPDTHQWRCPDCGHQTSCSYEQLAEVGSPICPDCDVEMQMS